MDAITHSTETYTETYMEDLYPQPVAKDGKPAVKYHTESASMHSENQEMVDNIKNTALASWKNRGYVVTYQSESKSDRNGTMSIGWSGNARKEIKAGA